MEKRGKFIVIEGTDGSGKGTQFKLLVSRLKKEGRRTTTFDFPQYNKPSSYLVREYLNGKYGSADEVGPYKASVFYGVDRFDISPFIIKCLKEGKIVVSNRYEESNRGHQGGKIRSKAARKKFYNWVQEFEYDILGIPRADFCIILHVPAEIAQQLVDQKEKRKYLKGKKRDIHENDLNHLKHAEAVYLEMARMDPKHFVVIECVKDGKLLSREEIHEKVWKVVRRRL